MAAQLKPPARSQSSCHVDRPRALTWQGRGTVRPACRHSTAAAHRRLIELAVPHHQRAAAVLLARRPRQRGAPQSHRRSRRATTRKKRSERSVRTVGCKFDDGVGCRVGRVAGTKRLHGSVRRRATGASVVRAKRKAVVVQAQTERRKGARVETQRITTASTAAISRRLCHSRGLRGRRRRC